MDDDNSAHVFPAPLNTPGVPCEGLLFASQQLKRAGLEDVTIFEKEEEWGGKTNTYYYKAPGYPNKKEVVVELGTCYLGNT